ncbi:MAG: hypothetical protein IID39_05435, partial [Planctomycetes bacterium]|nr:hypothetical protein [Planctomycetota bacterium]
GGAYASVPGGFANSAAGDFSFAGGRRAKALHLGSFVWGDSTAADFASTANDQFRVRATGGASFSHNVGIGTTTPGIPLTFANVLGNKISLWGQNGDQDHYGFGIQAGTLQMYAATGSKLAFGHGRSEAFTEKMQIATNGNVGIGGIEPATRLHVIGGTDSALGGGGFLTIGATNRINISIDDNEIMARNNRGASTLFLNNDGGLVKVGSGGISTTGNISFGSASGFTHFGPVTAVQRNTLGTNTILIISSAKAFCSLSLMDVEDTDSVGERAQCNVFIFNGFWYVQAFLPQNNDADVICQARCLRWD